MKDERMRSDHQNGQQEQDRAMNAAEAGMALAAMIGLAEPITAVAMWRLARLGHIPCVRLGRRVLFRRDDLLAFVARGGSR
jgi:hypothetical protein